MALFRAPILRVNHRLDRCIGGRKPAVDAEDLIELIGPEECRLLHVPFPTAELPDALCLRQIVLAALERRFCPPSFRDVLHGGDRPDVRAPFVKDGSGFQRGIETGAVLAEKLEIMPFGDAGLACRQVAFRQCHALFVHERKEMFADHFFLGVAQHGGHGRVDKGGLGVLSIYQIPSVRFSMRKRYLRSLSATAASCRFDSLDVADGQAADRDCRSPRQAPTPRASAAQKGSPFW